MVSRKRNQKNRKYKITRGIYKMQIVKGDRVEFKGEKGTAIGTYYMFTLGKRYVDVYLEDIKETVSLEESSLKKIR